MSFGWTMLIAFLLPRKEIRRHRYSPLSSTSSCGLGDQAGLDQSCPQIFRSLAQMAEMQVATGGTHLYEEVAANAYDHCSI